MRPHPVVAITGASAGIGRATARRLARDGSPVVVSARRRDRLDALVREVVQKPFTMAEMRDVVNKTLAARH